MKRKRFTLIRSFVLADVLTLANGACGCGSVFASMFYLISGDANWLTFAMILLPVALFFDFADGRVARWRHRSSPLGADLDSLADVISFGMAPAVIGLAVGLEGFWDVAILIYFVCCGISRLARFNVTAEEMSDQAGKVSHFEGTPIPTSVVIALLLLVMHLNGAIGPDVWLGSWSIGGYTVHPLSFVYALSGSLMISTIRIPKV